jgi:hypothetical protein
MTFKISRERELELLALSRMSGEDIEEHLTDEEIEEYRKCVYGE